MDDVTLIEFSPLDAGGEFRPCLLVAAIRLKVVYLHLSNVIRIAYVMPLFETTVGEDECTVFPGRVDVFCRIVYGMG